MKSASAPEGGEEGREACIAKIDALVNQYTTRRKEIEDSFIECGLEVPLVSRNLNATVNPVGPSFEPVGRDYRVKVEEEAQSRPVPEYGNASAGDEESMSPDDRLRMIASKISKIEDEMVKADLDDDYDARDRLEKEARELRTRRERIIAEIKSSRSKPALDAESLKRIDDLEAECRALRSQISMIRGEMADLLNQMDEVARRLGMDEELDEDDD